MNLPELPETESLSPLLSKASYRRPYNVQHSAQSLFVLAFSLSSVFKLVEAKEPTLSNLCG